uniref:IMS_C domain-containing protein n=1 Tax=Caenorhabditis japonica TaxID=281687 RepID=A0A8R1E7V3_CAEJA
MGHGICDTYTKSANINVPTNRAESLYAESMKLYGKISPKLADLRGVGVTCSKLKSRMRKDVVSAVQQMFGMTKVDEKEPKKNEKSNKIIKNQEEKDDDDDEENMQEEVVAPPPTVFSSNQEPNIQKVPHPKDIKPGIEVTVPGILKLSEIQIRRALKKLDGDQKKIFSEKLEHFLKKEPTKEGVVDLHSHLKSFLNAGKLSTFSMILHNFEELCIDSKKSHVDWFPAFYIIFEELKLQSKELLQFPIDKMQKRVPKPREVSKETKKTQNERRVPQEVVVFETTR